jgi:hypothetical protein
LFEGTFIGKLEKDVIIAPMSVTSMKPYNTLGMLGIGEILDFLSILLF